MEFKKQDKEERGKREANQETNLTIENKLMVIRGEVGGVIGEINDGD